MSESSPNRLVEHFFRHESGKLIAALTRFFGIQKIDIVEDMVQAALVEALRTWKINGVPDQPAAWIHRVAKNKIVDTLRRDATFRSKSPELAMRAENSSVGIPDAELDVLFDETELSDSLLRMMFACCHPVLSAESSIPLTLKTICGFNEHEIARGLLISDENVRKRIYRAKQTMIAQDISLELPAAGQLVERLATVHNVLYLMFNEGYSSSGSDQAIRLDLCEEAARLCHLLTENPHYSTGTTSALLALMLFHASRFQSRIDQEGALVLLEDQDRRQWDMRLMRRAFDYFSAASGDCSPTSYHIEAAIAMNHCKVQRFEDTNWAAIVGLYDRLIQMRPQPVYRLNRAIAVGERDGPAAGIEALDEIRNDPHLQRLHWLDAALGELYRKNGQHSLAEKFFQSAIEKAESPHDRRLLQRRLTQCQSASEGAG